VVRHCVRSKNLVNEEILAHWGLLHQKQANSTGLLMETSHSFICALSLVSALNIVHVIRTVAVCLLILIANCILMSVQFGFYVGGIVRTKVRTLQVQVLQPCCRCYFIIIIIMFLKG